MNVTVPPGVPVPVVATAAVKVTVSPTAAGLPEVVKVVVVAALICSLNELEVLESKLSSPL